MHTIRLVQPEQDAVLRRSTTRDLSLSNNRDHPGRRREVVMQTREHEYEFVSDIDLTSASSTEDD